MIRIVFIITGLSVGGAEMMLFKVLERLNRKRFAPCVISLTGLGELAPRIASLGVPVEALGMHRGLSHPLQFLRLVRALKDLKPDIVHTWMYHADFLGGIAALIARIPVVAWCIRNSNLDKDKTKLTTRLMVRVCALMSKWIPSGILCCSERARRIHVSLGYTDEKMFVVPNGFDLARFKPDIDARRTLRAELGVLDRVSLVGLIGRYDPQKNHPGFFRAAKVLCEHTRCVHFVLAGQGVDEDNKTLVACVANAGVADRTHLLGLRNDMPALMASLDVLVLPSYGEAFPNVLGEAMACGVPCVVTDVGDSAYIVGDTGRVVASGDMHGLASAVQELLMLTEQGKLALGSRARIRVSERFEISKVVRQYEEFYESMLARAR